MLENMMTYGYVGLFVIGFGAATILPMSSEAVFAAMIGSGFNPWICVVTASVGNWLGGMTNYYLGYLGKIEWLEKYLKIKRERIVKVQHFVAGKGAMSAFFAFAGGRGFAGVCVGDDAGEFADGQCFDVLRQVVSLCGVGLRNSAGDRVD